MSRFFAAKTLWNGHVFHHVWLIFVLLWLQWIVTYLCWSAAVYLSMWNCYVQAASAAHSCNSTLKHMINKIRRDSHIFERWASLQHPSCRTVWWQYSSCHSPFTPLTRLFDTLCCHVGTVIQHPVPAVICNFWHPGTLALGAEQQSAWMSKITNDGLSRAHILETS